jgi:hypothetical protein
MSDSIYAPPEAEVVTVDNDSPPYYVVGTTKFFLLSTMTFSMYFVYWFYRNWRTVSRRTGEAMWPVMRGVFLIFFTHSLFTDVDEFIKSKGKTFDWAPRLIATIFVILVIFSNITGQLSSNELIPEMVDVFTIALIPVLPLVIMPAQRAINFASDDPNGEGNSKLTVYNWLWLILGGLFWAATLLGLYAILFIPEFAE